MTGASVSGVCAGPWCLMALVCLSREMGETLNEGFRLSRQAHCPHHAVELNQKLWSFTDKFGCAGIGAEWRLEKVLFMKRAAAVNPLGQSPSASAEQTVVAAGARSIRWKGDSYALPRMRYCYLGIFLTALPQGLQRAFEMIKCTRKR